MGRLIYLLDSNILSEPAKAKASPRVMERLEQFGSGICTASVIVHEMRFGLARLPEGKRKTALTNYLNRLLDHPLAVLSYDREAASWHALERARQMEEGQAASYADSQIAAIAATNGLILVTRNVADFRFFRGLSLENWFEEP